MSLDRHPLWRKPQHHLDVTETSQHVHWIELFYDLAHVVAIFMLGNYLSHHLSVSGFLVFAALFVIIWFAWFDLSLFNSLYVSTDMQHRYIMTAQIITIMVMSASIPHVTDSSWFYFAIGYGINRTFIAFLYWRVRKVGDSDSELPTKLSRNFFGSAFLFFLSAFLPHPYSYLVFGLGLLLLALLYALPKVGALECSRFVPRFGHMSERFALLLLIVAGEGFFKLVVTLSIKGIDNVVGDVLFNYVIGGAAIFVLCWMYFDFAGNGKPRNRDKKTLVQWVLAHLTLMLSAVMIGVALSAEVKVSFMEQYPFKYALIGCLGLALYLYSLLLIQNVIELRTAHRFATAKLRYVGIAMAFVTLAVVSFVPSIIGNLFWFSALLSQIVVPATTAYRTFTKEG